MRDARCPGSLDSTTTTTVTGNTDHPKEACVWKGPKKNGLPATYFECAGGGGTVSSASGGTHTVKFSRNATDLGVSGPASYKIVDASTLQVTFAAGCSIGGYVGAYITAAGGSCTPLWACVY